MFTGAAQIDGVLGAASLKAKGKKRRV